MVDRKMSKKLTLIVSLVLMLSCLLQTHYSLVEVKAPNGYPVHNLNTGLNYTTIQGAIDAPETVNGNTIFVQSGVYYGKIVVDKGISLIGQDRDRTVIDGNSSEGGVHITREGVMLTNFTVRNCRNNGVNGAIYLDQADYCEVTSNVITNCSGGILLYYSEASNVSGNLIDRNYLAFGVFGGELSEFTHSIDTSNLVNGKSIYYLVNQSDLAINPSTFPQVGYLALVSSRNVVVENLTLTNNWQGLLLAYVNNTRIVGNRVLNNGVGMVISQSLNNSVLNNVASGNGIGVVGSGISLDHSQGNTIATNLVTGNYIGINPACSSNNSICHNNIMGNIEQIYAHSSMDMWNSDYPSGGNYWSDYNGIDSDHDGLGDTAYVIDANNTDNYPLMGMFSDFNANSEQRLQTICNSTITDFQFDGATIVLTVSGQNGTFGFCRICIPSGLMVDNFTVFVWREGQLEEVNSTLLPCSNSNNSYLYFNYKLTTLNTLKGRADLNKEGFVNLLDLCILAKACNSAPSDPEWKPEADLNNDGVINVLDMVLLLSVIGENTNIATHRITIIISEFPSSLILLLFAITTLLAVMLHRRKHTF